jgi:hypothetical protein
MIPKIIGKISIEKTPSHEVFLRSGSVGEIYDDKPCDNDPIFRDLCDLCTKQNLRPISSSRSFYTPVSYSYGIGSIPPHSDKGMGLTAGVLVATAAISNDLYKSDLHDCYLFHQHAEVLMYKIQIGDVFIFDADCHHAWMANCRWLLALHAVECKNHQ